MAEKVELKESDFTFEDDTGKWKPLPPEITATGPETPPETVMPEPTPQLTGTALPEQLDTPANIVRYGVPTTVGLATGGLGFLPELAIGGLTAGLSEITARQIERASTDADLDSIWQDIAAGGVAGALDVAVGAGTRGLLGGVTKIARRALLPRKLPPDVELAQTVLGRMKEPQLASKWYQFKPKSQPFSLTLGQLNNEERGLVTWLEGIARGGTGRGIMTKFDLRNTDHIAEALEKYFTARTSQMTGPEMGVFLNKLLGEVDDPINAIKPVEAFKAFLYRRFDDALASAGATVDLSSVQRLLAQSKSPELLKIYKKVNLPGPSGKTPLPPIKAKKSSAAAAGKLGELNAKQPNPWSQIPAEDVDRILHEFSDFFASPDRTVKRAAGILKDSIDNEFNKVIDTIPGAREARDVANSYFGQKEAALFNGVLKSLRKTMERSPSGIAALLDPIKGNAAIKYDKLQRIKNAVYFSAATPAVEGSVGGIGKQNAIKLYEKSIIHPLRFRFVDAASDQFGRLDPHKLIRQVEKIEAEAPEMLTELWGSQTQVDHIKNLASTYETILNSTPEKSVFIQLKTAGAIGGGMGAAWSYFNGDNPTAGGIGGAALGATVVLVSPNALARVLANPRLTRALTDGLSSSARSGGISSNLAMAFRKIGEMKAASTLFRDNPSSDAMQFYNFAPIEEVPPESQ